jgi:hypothetical protein
VHASASPAVEWLTGDELPPKSGGVHRGQARPWAELATAPHGCELGWFAGRLRNGFQNRKNECLFLEKDLLKLTLLIS